MHTAHLPWVRGDHHDIQVTLRRLFTQLHAGERAAAAAAGSSNQASKSNHPTSTSTLAQHSHQQSYQQQYQPASMHMQQVQVSRMFWVRLEDLAEVEFHVLQHMPAVGGGGSGSQKLSTPGALEARCGGSGGARALLSPRTSVAGGGGVGGAGSGTALQDDVHCRRVSQVYLDNKSLELYHSMLYGRPYATTVGGGWRLPHAMSMWLNTYPAAQFATFAA
jgi:SPX domain protein involved in polyphosphate accumulation